MASQQWFYQVMGEEVGPISSAELRTLAQHGTISADTLVRKAPDDTWILADRVQGLFPAFDEAKAQPKPPPVCTNDEKMSSPLAKQPESLLESTGLGKALPSGPPQTPETGRPYRSVLILAWVGAGAGVISLVVSIAVALAVFGSGLGEPVQTATTSSSGVATVAIPKPPDTEKTLKSDEVAKRNAIIIERRKRIEALQRKVAALGEERDTHRANAKRIDQKRRLALFEFVDSSSPSNAYHLYVISYARFIMKKQKPFYSDEKWKHQ